MKVIKELKYGKYIWDEDNETLVVWDSYGNKVILNTVYMFVTARFITRIQQKYFTKGIRKQKELIKKRAEREAEKEIHE